ncbi:MAG TPA: hypothetical protein VGI55_11480 [Solirubrobacteraceae bacterium]
MLRATANSQRAAAPRSGACVAAKRHIAVNASWVASSACPPSRSPRNAIASTLTVTLLLSGAGEMLIGKDALSTTRSPFSAIAVGLGRSGALSNAPNETVWIPAVWATNVTVIDSDVPGAFHRPGPRCWRSRSYS